MPRGRGTSSLSALFCWDWMVFSTIPTCALAIQRRLGSESRGLGAALAPALRAPCAAGMTAGIARNRAPCRSFRAGRRGAECGLRRGDRPCRRPAGLAACPGSRLPSVLPMQAGDGQPFAGPSWPSTRALRARSERAGVEVPRGRHCCRCAPCPRRPAGPRAGATWPVCPGARACTGPVAARAMGFMEAPPCGAVGCKGDCIAGAGAPRRQAAVAAAARAGRRVRRLRTSRRGRRGARRAGDGRGVVRRNRLHCSVRRGRHDGRVRFH